VKDETNKVETDSTSESENPAIPSPEQHTSGRPQSNRDWWPNQVDLSVLNKPAKDSDPLGDSDYRAEFTKLDVEEVKRDVAQLMRTSQDWWPADWGHYGPLFIRLSWHASGTYRIADGRGGGGEGGGGGAPRPSRPSTAGRTTPTSTRPAACCCRSSRSTAASSPGPTCSSWPATSPTTTWA
jgi:catalase-peroxidase